MPFLQTILNQLSTLLLIPTMVLLLAGAAAVVIMLYTTVLAALRRPSIRNAMNNIQQGDAHERYWDTLRHRPRFRQVAQLLMNPATPYVQQQLSTFEIHCAKESELPRILVRVGPMLGLMGTLIPMGPALTSLASGDIASMASNLQIAFATTVVGIVVGGCAFLTGTLLQRWQAEEMVVLETLAVRAGIHGENA